VHSSLLQAQIAMLDFQASRWLMAGEIAPQTGNEHPTTVPTNLYKCSDGAVNIAVSGDVIWRRLCDALGKPEWAENPDYADAAHRKTNRDALNAEIEAVTQTMTMSQIVDTLLEAGVPTGPAYSINEVFADPQVQHLGMAADIDTLPFGQTQMVAQPIRMSRTNTSMAAHPPDRGEHTDEILTETGYTPEEIAAMHANNTI
jgi:formyl-CoA transferase